MAATITVVGSANLDLIITAPALPKIGETLTGGAFTQAFGGKGSNQMIAARRAGGDVVAVASLGDDAYGREYRRVYEDEGIDTAHVVMRPDAPTGVAVIQVDKDGNNTITLAAGANALLTPEDVRNAEPAIAASSLLMLQMEIPDAPIAEAVRLATQHGVRVMFNFAPVRETALALSPDIAILVVNEPEASSLTGMAVDSPDQAEAAARKLAARGHALVIVTLGANGCLTLEGGRAVRHPAHAIRAVDTTAAGDSFCGALAVALGEGRDTAEAVRFATAAGALCAMRAGAMPSVPGREAIERFMAENPIYS